MPEDSIEVVYRDDDRTPLLYVLREQAAKHEGLEVQIRKVFSSEEYEQGFLGGDFELICEHLRFLFPAKLEGHPVRCLATCQNWSNEKFLVRPDINDLGDLVGHTVAIRATPSSQISGNHWLKRLGLEGKVQVLVVDDNDIGRWQQWRKVESGEADAVIGSPLYLDEALAAGLKVLDIRPLPEIGALFFAALGPFVSANEGKLRRFFRALYRALYTFHHDPQSTIAIMSGEPARLMHMSGQPDVIKKQYERLRDGYDERPVPRLDALETTFAMLNAGYARLDDLNPLSLWDLHYVIELEEERFLERLAAGEV